MKTKLVLGFLACCCSLTLLAGTARQVSGIYPHLATFNEEGECGTGAVVPWAGRLWVVSYAPHAPKGSSDKLYEITPDLQQIIRPESIGGTPANRMIHRESNQLFIGPYAVDAQGRVRVISYTNMFGRPTGNARHLTDPANKIYYASMEEAVYEVDVHTLAVKELWADEYFNKNSGWNGPARDARFADFPGYHGKGFYSGQGRLVYANNGEHGRDAQSRPDVPSGVLAEWDGVATNWTIVRRNQFTEVTGPGGIYGNANPATDPVWSVGWDHRSLILMLLDGGKWHAFRLPKAAHTYDGAHGWNTEWPRIREIGERDFLMTMHGAFWRFPRGFSLANTAGIAPRSTYLKVIGDFALWKDRVVFGCDDTAKSEFLNKAHIKGDIAGPGKSQSNLWFVEPDQLDHLGPVLGRGAVWANDNLPAGAVSDPFLFSGYAYRSLWLTHGASQSVTFVVEVDTRGNGQWKPLREIVVPAKTGLWTDFGSREKGAWVRLTTRSSAPAVFASFQYRGDDDRSLKAAPAFAGVLRPGVKTASGGLLHARGGDFKTLRFVARDTSGLLGCYDLDGNLKLRKTNDLAGIDFVQAKVAIPRSVISVEAASVLYVDPAGNRWRLPKGDPVFDGPGALGPERAGREVCTERNLLNIHGSFYEMPADNAGGFAKIRPITTHNRRIVDYASYRGLLVLSGVEADARGEHVVRSEDGKCALWVGAVDDLWKFGKARGHGGPWLNTPVQAGVPSDAYLITGYDKKRVTLSHQGTKPVRMRLEADISGSGTWVTYREFEVQPGKPVEHAFPDSFGAYWIRAVADQATSATVQLVYE